MEKKDFVEAYRLMSSFKEGNELKKKDLFNKKNVNENVWNTLKKDNVVVKNKKGLFVLKEKGFFFLDFLERRRDILDSLTYKNYQAVLGIYNFLKKERPDIDLSQTVYEISKKTDYTGNLLSWESEKSEWNFLWSFPQKKKIDLLEKLPVKNIKSLYGEVGVDFAFSKGEIILNENKLAVVKFLSVPKSPILWFVENDFSGFHETLKIKKEGNDFYEPSFIIEIKERGITFLEEESLLKSSDDYLFLKNYVEDREDDANFYTRFYFIKKDKERFSLLKGDYKHKNDENNWKRIKKIKIKRNYKPFIINLTLLTATASTLTYVLILLGIL